MNKRYIKYLVRHLTVTNDGCTVGYPGPAYVEGWLSDQDGVEVLCDARIRPFERELHGFVDIGRMHLTGEGLRYKMQLD